MATIEKLIKAFEALKVFQPGGFTSDDSKKKDQPVSKKDKMMNCNIVADCICAPNMRAIIDFPKFLGIAMETFLTLCDDAESDVRMVADECLNRSIKVLLETNLGRLQVELYKEIKKNGPSRTLRAALWRFADMAALIRPQKCRPYIVNMLPCLARICKREEEAIQETLQTSMVKICPALMVFANESEIKALLKSFLPNLKSASASCRRTAANSLVLICQYSRSPTSFYNYLLNILLDMVLPVDADHDLHTLMGVVLCMRLLVPHLGEASLMEQGLKGSFGVMTKEKTESVSKDQLIKVVQTLLHLMTHRDHNVVTAALEAFQQLLRNPTPLLTSILTVPGTITRTLVYLADQASSPSNDSLQEIPSFSKLADESAGLEDDTDIPEAILPPTVDTGSDASTFDYHTLQSEQPGENQAVGGSEDSSPVDTPIIVTTTDSEYSGIEIGDLNDDKSEKSNMTQVCSSSQETLLSVQSISPTRKSSLLKGVSQDLNGNPEIEDLSEGDKGLLPSPGEELPYSIGSITDKQPAIVFCIRFICSRFLLSGTRRVLKPDKAVRVSVKSLALSCVSSAVTIYPQLFLLNIFTEVTQELDQDIEDVLLYASHPDPQLKGNTTQIISNLLTSALRESRGNFTKWLSTLASKKDMSVESLVDIILDVVEDGSSVAIRLAINSLQACITPLLQSIHSDVALLIILKLMEVKDNPYWLVKVEILELLGSINFKILVHLESCCTASQRGKHHYLGKLHLQHRVINDIIIPLLGNEDHRVRHCAAQTLVRIVPHLFYASDHCQQDPVIAVAKDHTTSLLTPDLPSESPPLVQGLVKPFHLGAENSSLVYIESSLSRVVMSLLYQLNMSNSKHFTYGCCHALCLLSDGFPATQYSHSWGCGPPTPLLPRDSSNRMVMRRPPSRSLSGSSTFSLDEMSAGSGGGPLTIILSLLTSSLVGLDLSAHNDTLRLAGNLVSGAAYKCLRTIDNYNNSGDSTEDTKWQGISDRVLFPLIEQFLTHLARLLNACCHVIDEQSPGPPQIKPTLPSLPNAPSLSPIKRKAKGEKESGSGGPGTPGSAEKSTPKQQKDKDKEPEKERNKKDGLGTFYSLPHYMKLYEVLRGAYSTYKISLDLGTSDKFCSLLKGALESLGQVLEIASLQDIGKYAEELLGYLRTTVSLEPTYTILCVQQLLKALFGTNLVSQWEPQQASNPSRKPGKATRLTANTKPGLYSHCFTQPYSHFTQSLAGATFKATGQADQEETTSMLNWLKKCVERKLPAILKPGSKTDKTAIAAYIRLFEPLVIKALKQYTVTSCLELQKQVLDLLSQLIQLRVNYCLLDSDQVFIGFIIKQIEFIEEGQIRNSESLIPNLFNFLVMLSYEKYHSKSIIGMPKIIQLCDGIMASGLHPTSHAIPALKPIVYDLFLIRAANKSDISRELETQREVVVSMLLRLIQYHETLDLLVIILQQCHKESEERWKKLSRQITDAILPALAKQQVSIDSMAALETLHRLLESLAPLVFRPVDILLKTLLQEPMDVSSVETLQRWMSLVLSILRVLMAQSKEEVILSRMQELGLGLAVFKVPSRDMTPEERDLAMSLSPEEVIAWYLIQVVGNCVSFISQKCDLMCSSLSSSTLFLTQQLSHLLLYITHMFQSGLFRKVATSAMKASHLDTPHCYHSIQELNRMFLSVSMTLPTLTLQWSNILILLNFDDQSLWSEIMQTPKRYLKPGKSQSADLEVQASPLTHCCNLEILRQGGLVLFCDYVCENLTEAEHMTWLVINHVSDIIALSNESPVQDFVSAIHRNSSASSLFIQAIHARCENVSKPSLVRKTMKCLEAIHLSQTGSLLTLLIDKFLNTHHLAVARICDSIACKRVETLLADSVQDAFKQLPLEDLDKLLQYMDANKLIKRHARLVSLLKKLRQELKPDDTSVVVGEKPHPLSVPESLSEIHINKECYLSIVKHQCFSLDCNPRECARLLHQLDYPDILSITMTKEFNLCILQECILLGAHNTLIKNNDISDVLDSEGNKIPREPSFDHLLQAAQLTLVRHINNIINLLPVPHQLLKYGEQAHNSKRTRYLEKMDDFFSDTSWSDMVFMLVSSLNVYIQTLSAFPWQPELPDDSHCDIGRFCVLCAEMVDWMFHHDLLPTSERLNSCLQCISLILQHPQLSSIIGQKQHSTWVCALTATAYQIVNSLMVVPGEKLTLSVTHDSGGEHSRESQNDLIIRACDQTSELVEFSQQHLSTGSNVIPSFLQQNLRNIIIGLGRQPVLNSYARTPSVVWKMGWIPSPNGEPKTKLPPLPVDYLEDKEVLKEYVYRVNKLGWINRQQFEETWMSLLAVVNPVTIPSNGQEVSPEEEIERAQCTVIAVKAITSLLIQSTLIPVPGNTSNSSYEIRPRDKPLGFLHTRCGKKLTVIRGVIEQEVHNLYCQRSARPGRGKEEKDSLRYMFDSNLEREIMEEEYTLGQIAIEGIWSIVGALDFHIAESDTTDSLESPNTESPDTPGRSRQQFPLLSFERERRERPINFSGLDIHSCLQFLLELYGQWMLANPRPPLMLRNEVVKSIVCLSDLFVEREQYDWMLETLLDLYKTHPQEDEIIMQYLNVGICKAAAVVGTDNATTEKLMKVIDNGFKSPHLPSRVSALHGTLYLLEAGIQDVTKLLVPLATEFLLKNLSTLSQSFITSQNYLLTMWSTAFYIMENYHIDLKDLEFPSKVLQLAVITASASEDSVSTTVYLAILKGLERLLLTDVLSKQDAEAIIKLGVDRLCLPSPQRSLAALGLMFTCMYSGKQYDQYSPSPRDMEPNVTVYDFDVLYQDPESLILAMERVTVLFDRIKKGYPYEARVISRVLPTFLADFFPPQDVMNKVIGEFISSQQPYPQVVAKVVFQVFSNLHQQRQQTLVRDWVMLSLSNFTQRTPIAMAMWSLTCFFISASLNPWLRALLPHVIGRMGHMDVVDCRLFCLTAVDFYRQLTDDSQRRAFTSTFQAVSQTGVVYQDLLNHISNQAKE